MELLVLFSISFAVMTALIWPVVTGRWRVTWVQALAAMLFDYVDLGLPKDERRSRLFWIQIWFGTFSLALIFAVGCLIKLVEMGMQFFTAH